MGEILKEQLYNSQGEQTEFKKGDIVKDVNPDCPHHGSEGEVEKIGKGTIVYKVTNDGATYSEGDDLEKSVDQMVVIAQNPFAGDHERAKKQPMGESIKEDVGISTYLGGIVQSMRKAGLKPKTAKQMKHGFSKSRDKIGFFIDVEQRGFDKKEMYTLQVEIDRDGNLWYLSGHRPMKLGKWADTSKIVRMWKALNKVKAFGQDAIFKKR